MKRKNTKGAKNYKVETKNYKSGSKKYKILIIVCFVLIAINITITCFTLFKLNEKFTEVDNRFSMIYPQIAKTVVNDEVVETKEDVEKKAYSFGKLTLDIPENWELLDATEYWCQDYGFCSDNSNRMEITLSADSVESYDEYMKNLETTINGVSNGKYASDYDDHKVWFEYFVDYESDPASQLEGSVDSIRFSIVANYENGRVDMRLINYHMVDDESILSW